MKDLPLKAKIFVLGTIFLALFMIVPTHANFEFSEVWLTIALCVMTSLTQIVKVEGPTDKSSFNLSWVLYGFSLLVLGVPQTIIVIIVSHISEWIWHKYPWSIQAFNIASHTIVMIASGLVLGALQNAFTKPEWLELPIVLTTFAFFTVLNHLWVGLVIKFARGQGLRESGVLSGYSLILDFTLLCLGGASAYIWTINPMITILNAVPLYLIYNTLKVPALQRKTDIDQKTGLFNSRFFSETVEKELSRSNRFKRPLTVVMADMDYLRNINNKYGHIAGDEVIIEIANILKSSFRDYDVVSRFGGEEFAILMPETVLEEAFPRVEKLRKLIEEHGFVVSTSVEPIQVTMSFGVAQRDGNAQTKDQLLHNADKALYQAKLSGRNRVMAYQNSFDSNDDANEIPILKDQFPSQTESELKVEVLRETKEFVREQSLEQVAKKLSEKKNENAKHQSLPTKDHSIWKVRLFVGLMTFLASTLFIFLVGVDYQVDWYGLALFTILALVAEALSVDIYVKSSSVSTSAVPFIAGLLLYGPMGALVIGSGIAIISWIKNRKVIHRLIFNISNHVIGGLLCYIVLLVVKDQIPASYFGPMQFVLGLVFGGLLFLSTTALVSVAICLDKGVSMRVVWMKNFQWLGPVYVGMGALGYALILGFQSSDILGVIAIIAPIMLLRFSQFQYLARTKKLVKTLQTTNTDLAERSIEIEELNAELLQVLADVIDLRDPFVLGHSQSVAKNARRLAQELGLAPERVEAVYKAGLLHDLGKIGIPEDILQKPGMLTKAEFEEVKKHPDIAAQVVAKCHSLQDLVPIIRHHHEKFDGTGYPEGLQGTEIPIESRVITMVDVVEAMTSDRPYRIALEPQRVIEEVKEMSGEVLDPQVVEVFLSLATTEGHLFFQNSAIDVKEKISENGNSNGKRMPGNKGQLLHLWESI
jgi:diguanylate cyclase (GGDEF)-like protein/putative nucleotidyltransferase with HDIG domain